MCLCIPALNASDFPKLNCILWRAIMNDLFPALKLNVHLQNVRAVRIAETDDVVLAALKPRLPVVCLVAVFFSLLSSHNPLEEFAMEVELENALFRHVIHPGDASLLPLDHAKKQQRP
jgi:hypothetical protein